jgi:two-component system sensor histidine kinase/response regulator
MVTAHGREMLIQRSEADQALIGGYLVKPITASMLLNAVEEARGGSEHRHISTTNGSTEKRLDGMRILLAEDNLNNQQIAQELLDAEGAILVIVNNGQEAVDAVANINPAFDVVLMDLQMPVMDGMTATQHIRHKLNNSTLPIIAMTANAMASDREACLKAGMNNHVGKPFDLKHLINVLRSQAGWQDIETSAVTSSVQASEISTEIEKAANAVDVDIVSAIHRLGGKQDLYLRMLPMFLKSLETMPEQLRAHLADGELKTASHLLHSLKGLAATMGVTALSAEAAAGEKLLTNETPRETAEQIIEHLCHAITTALPALKILLARLQLDSAIVEVDISKTVTTDIIEAEKNANTLDTQALITSLQALAQQLQNSDMAAFNTLSALQNQFGIALNEQLKPLNSTINNLNFSQALLLCQELIHTHQHST